MLVYGMLSASYVATAAISAADTVLPAHDWCRLQCSYGVRCVTPVGTVKLTMAWLRLKSW